jgi:hypothetical protein
MLERMFVVCASLTKCKCDLYLAVLKAMVHYLITTTHGRAIKEKELASFPMMLNNRDECKSSFLNLAEKAVELVPRFHLTAFLKDAKVRLVNHNDFFYS